MLLAKAVEVRILHDNTSTNYLPVKVLHDSAASDYIPVFSAVIAAGGVVFGLYQYLVGRRVKRLEYLDGLAKTMREDPLLKAATLLLDWDLREITVGEKKFIYRTPMLNRALLNHNEMVPPDGFTEEESAIRDVLDAFFGFLENVAYAIHIGVITRGDVFAAPWSYYFSKMAEKDSWTGGKVSEYLEVYGFARTKQLLAAYLGHTKYKPTASPWSEHLFEEDKVVKRPKKRRRLLYLLALAGTGYLLCRRLSSD